MAWRLSSCLFVSFFCVLSTSTLAKTKSDSKKEIRFEVKSLQIGSSKLKVEIADTPEKQARGLMFRTKLSEGMGMLFIFDIERTQSFWMKNTFIPLDIGYFNKDRVLIDVQQMDPVKSIIEVPKSYISSAPAKYALEVPKGWFKKSNTVKGMKFHLD